MDTIYNELIDLRKKQEGLASDYEEKDAYEMAYLSRWYVLEKILKIVDTKRRKEQLYELVCEWKKYLDNHISIKPKEIKAFNLTEANNIPDIGKMEEYLNTELPVLKEIMNSKAKWRRRRNGIAHDATPFGKKETYENYRDKILKGISEIETGFEW